MWRLPGGSLLGNGAYEILRGERLGVGGRRSVGTRYFIEEGLSGFWERLGGGLFSFAIFLCGGSGSLGLILRSGGDFRAGLRYHQLLTDLKHLGDVGVVRCDEIRDLDMMLGSDFGEGVAFLHGVCAVSRSGAASAFLGAVAAVDFTEVFELEDLDVSFFEAEDFADSPLSSSLPPGGIRRVCPTFSPFAELIWL
jgi:hypothetical protein